MNNSTDENFADFKRRVEYNTSHFWLERAATKSWLYTLLILATLLFVLSIFSGRGEPAAILSVLGVIALSGVHELAKQVLELRSRLEKLEKEDGR